jgi:hypothetical protein
VVIEYYWDEGHSSVHVFLGAQSVEEVNRNGGGRFLSYIDERTICAGGRDGFVFTRID